MKKKRVKSTPSWAHRQRVSLLCLKACPNHGVGCCTPGPSLRSCPRCSRATMAWQRAGAYLHHAKPCKHSCCPELVHMRIGRSRYQLRMLDTLRLGLCSNEKRGRRRLSPFAIEKRRSVRVASLSPRAMLSSMSTLVFQDVAAMLSRAPKRRRNLAASSACGVL